MICEKCGSTKFYIKSVDITIDYEGKKLTMEQIVKNLGSGHYIDFDNLKEWLVVKCANLSCENVLYTTK